MSDIVERLRTRAAHYSADTPWQSMIRLDCIDAADEIEKLRAQVVALQSSLEVGKRTGKKTPA